MENVFQDVILILNTNLLIIMNVKMNVLMDKNLLAEYSADLYKYDETTANRPVQGIVLHKGSPLHKAGYYHGDVIIGVVKNAVHFDEAVTFLQQLLRDRN